ncbi:nucleotidyltransferase [Paenibacillus sp. LMG 31460]|uniref:Nucleotidyltransferase n=1 Tax=Paenibacillus germinis TaxID=2654979 RepID=A0ABX1YWZ0_9BACL|nr:nucleotidyltransferase [Paenibacillus germinis]NOU84245.1 nucleotidyltransferase [Paenibacillus germinis]
MKFTEKQLLTYAAPLSESEEERCKNAIRMIRDAMKLIGYTDNDKEIYQYEGETTAYALELNATSGRKIFLLVQGSYANNTNVRTQSDVDVAVILESTFIPEYRATIKSENYGFTDATFTVKQLKDEVESALKTKFNNEGIERNDKSIKVHGNSYRVDSDVVPSYRYRDYRGDYNFSTTNYVGGIEIRPDSGGKIINFPEQHIKNGKRKNNETNHKFKKHVRIIKKMKSLIKESGYSLPTSISSFGLESLLWNIPNTVYAKYSFLRYTFHELLIYLKNDLENLENYKEANGVKPLFTSTAQKDDYATFIKMLSEYYQYDITEA